MSDRRISPQSRKAIQTVAGFYQCKQKALRELCRAYKLALPMLVGKDGEVRTKFVAQQTRRFNEVRRGELGEVAELKLTLSYQPVDESHLISADTPHYQYSKPAA